jgi:hypothetical protein
MEKRVMEDERPIPLTIKTRAALPAELCRSALGDTLFSPLFYRPWQEAEVKTRQEKGIENETAIKHMDHADSWFFVVRADHPGRTCSIEG